jgi:hypothetical protein
MHACLLGGMHILLVMFIEQLDIFGGQDQLFVTAV